MDFDLCVDCWRGLDKMPQQLEKKRTINKVFRLILDVFCAILIVVALFVSIGFFISACQGTPTCCFGVSRFTITSPSMVASGFNVGDNIAIRKVDTSTVKQGDKIAYYLFDKSINKFDVNICIKVDNDTIGDTKFDNSIGSWLGIASHDMVEASKANATKIFHEVVEIFLDDNGVRWFKTKGTSNDSDDGYFVEDKMVIGIYDEGEFAKFLSSFAGGLSSPYVTVALLVPFVLVGIWIVVDFKKNIKKSK